VQEGGGQSSHPRALPPALRACQSSRSMVARRRSGPSGGERADARPDRLATLDPVDRAGTRHTSGLTPSVCGSVWETMYRFAERYPDRDNPPRLSTCAAL
jgi:hypothetical protein